MSWNTTSTPPPQLSHHHQPPVIAVEEEGVADLLAEKDNDDNNENGTNAVVNATNHSANWYVGDLAEDEVDDYIPGPQQQNQHYPLPPPPPPEQQQRTTTTTTISGSSSSPKLSSTSYFIPKSLSSTNLSRGSNKSTQSSPGGIGGGISRSQHNNHKNSPRGGQRKGFIHLRSRGDHRTTESSSDVLQLSDTGHKWAGNGILANVDDLALSPETFAAGCNLLQAAARGDIEQMQQLLDSGRTHVNFRDYDRRTALHVAASEGQYATVQYLVTQRHAKINRSDRWGGSPLDDAHRHRHHTIVTYLRQHGAVTGSGNRWTNLIQAAADGDYDEVQTLLQLYTKSKAAAQQQQQQATTASTLDINRGDYDKRTALHLAAGEGHVHIVRALCEAGADVNVEDRWLRRPLDDAQTGHHTDCVTTLVAYGAIQGIPASDPTTATTTNVLDDSIQRAMDNMLVEFTELEMIDRIGSGAFGEIYKCRWRGTLVAAKIIKSAKIRRDWMNRRLTSKLQQQQQKPSSSPMSNNNNKQQDIEDVIREMDQEAAALDMSETEKDMAVTDFRQEISVLKSLRHPHIVLLLAYSTTANYECLISELMKCSLLDVFRSHNVQGTKMSPRTQIVYATQLAQGMNYLHTCKPPIIHRDLKPANLLIDHAGSLKISDFGLSKVRPDPGKNETEVFTMTGETGSYRFMAPEVFRHEEYNTMVDVYSYSMIVFYLLVGRPPWPNLAGLDAVRRAAYDGDRPNIPRHIDQRLQNLLKECWDDHANVRPPFRHVIAVLNKYSHDALHEDSNTVLTTNTDHHMRRRSGCNCVVQ